MMNKMPWFRVYSELLNDKKIKRISRIMQLPRAYIVGAWVTILCLANESPARGRLMLSDDIPMGEDDIFDELGMEPEMARRLIDNFINLAMLTDENGLTITNWNERQFKSDNSTARVQKHRAKQAEKTGNVSSENSETLQKRSSNVIDTETDTEQIQNREDTEQSVVVAAYENTFGPMASRAAHDLLLDDVATYGQSAVVEALDIARQRKARSYKYVEGILRNRKASSANGTAPGTDLLEKIMTAVRTYGRPNARQARDTFSDDEWAMVSTMGGWSHLCSMTPDKIQISYYSARKAASHAR
jgi:hypothetical protein